MLVLNMYDLLASRYGAQRLEARLRGVEVLELENLEADGSVAAREPEANVDGVERTAFGISAEPAADVQATVRLCGNDVERLDPEVAAQFPNGGERGEISVGAGEEADAGATA